ncbi:histone methylation protein DOT1-domain-containing protein [Polychytrium aggregatum]|uniref:histone methylation protein DOT1-domain-containing protein n=1 Tax=Polychytrium aggregatum TaxID=110093 RepID=UPI0022FED847|nr:histone methylation protein DOT1-domain-containing protein [Polychytrium aggregatum]KAI9202104.1 histone methylation protein DOT1-domain-containing protein [Polychytrium aggregatum]
MDSLERQSAGGLLVSAPSDSKTDAKVAEPGASHPSSVLSEKKKEAKPRQDPTLPRPKDNRHISKRSLLPCVDALTVIQSTSAHYISFDTAVSGGKRPNGFAIESIDLEYPGIDAVEKFPLVVPTKLGEYNPTHDIYTTTQMIVEFCIPKEHSSKFGDTKHGTLRKIIKSCHRRNVQDLRDGVAAFNAQLRELKKQGLFERCEGLGGAASPKLVSHILDQAYARSVAPYSNHLNNYREFSNNVYGEVKHSLVSEIIDRAKIQPHHVFLDMGSGIGNVVLQIAAQCLCESYGIEVMPIPSKLAKKQCKELLSRLRYYAKPCGKITLKQGDFLEDPEIHDVIRRADIIFVNNYAFDAQLNQRILHKFLDLKDTAKVVSLKNFVPIDRKVSLRRSNAIESIFSIEEHYFARDSVSWTNEGGRYFIHTVDRASLGELHKQL